MHGWLSLSPLAPLPLMRTSVDLYTRGNSPKTEFKLIILFPYFPATWFIYHFVFLFFMCLRVWTEQALHHLWAWRWYPFFPLISLFLLRKFVPWYTIFVLMCMQCRLFLKQNHHFAMIRPNVQVFTRQMHALSNNHTLYRVIFAKNGFRKALLDSLSGKQ